MNHRYQTNLFLTLDSLVAKEHPYRKLESLLDFAKLSRAYQHIYSAKGRQEKGVEFGIRTLVLQFMEDLSDRELERFLQENTAGKWFCGLGLTDKSPDHSYFGAFRKRLGTENLLKIFNHIRRSLKAMGLLREVFTFVDASQLVSKLSTWDDRDKAIKKGLGKFNNTTTDKVAADKDARFGCKGKNKYWYGYKEHASVDMQSGLINKIAATSAEVTDATGVKYTCPDGGAVYGDKAYCLQPAQKILRQKNCHDATIKKNNMHDKDKAKDYWLSKIRSPYERVFAHRNKKVRYRGLDKVRFQVISRALVFNLKRLSVLGIERIELEAV